MKKSMILIALLLAIVSVGAVFAADNDTNVKIGVKRIYFLLYTPTAASTTSTKATIGKPVSAKVFSIGFTGSLTGSPAALTLVSLVTLPVVLVTLVVISPAGLSSLVVLSTV